MGSGFGSQQGNHSPAPHWLRYGIAGFLGAAFGYGAAGAAGLVGAGAGSGAGAGAVGGGAMDTYMGGAAAAAGGGSMDAGIGSLFGSSGVPWSSIIQGGGNLIGGMMSNSANSAQAAQQRDWQAAMQLQNQMFNQESANAGMAFNSEQAARARDWSADQAMITRDFNAEQAKINRDFQAEMSNTQYQRATKDMMAAGLNPMLGYSQGGAGNVGGSTASSSTPSGASASGMSAAGSGVPSGARAHIANVLGPALSSALNAAAVGAQIDQTNALTEQTKAQAYQTVANTELLKKQTGVASADEAKRVMDNQLLKYYVETGYGRADIRNKSEALGQDVAAGMYKPAVAAEKLAQEKAETAAKEYDLPRREADMQFQKWLMDNIHGGSSSAKAIAAIVKFLTLGR